MEPSFTESESRASRRWRAMGSEVHTVVYAEPPATAVLTAHAETRIAELESRWTRFQTTSEISALNAARGRPVRCSTETVRLVEALVNAWRVTGGAFDPTLLGSLVELGYDVSRDRPADPIDLAPECYTRGRPDGVLIDPDASLVQLPAGTALDAGGLGKGLAADIVLAELLDRGADAALVSIGGDLAVAGTPHDDDSWRIELQPHPGADTEVVRLAAGGVATSSTRRRTWHADGSTRHHLIDPATGRPTTGPVVGASVIAGSAATAEAFTKCAFVSGVDAAIATYERMGLAARIWCRPGNRRHGPEDLPVNRARTVTWATFAIGARVSTGAVR